MSTLIKYLGTADTRTIAASENFAGRLASPVGADLEWNHSNHFIVDVEEAGWSDEAVELLLSDSDFRNVTGLKTYPLSLSEQRRNPGLTHRPKAESVLEDVSEAKKASTEPTKPSPEVSTDTSSKTKTRNKNS